MVNIVIFYKNKSSPVKKHYPQYLAVALDVLHTPGSRDKLSALPAVVHVEGNEKDIQYLARN